MQELKRFPIGVQDFERLRNDGKYYVDKTDLVYKMTHTDDYYFLSRPRRFGKSLLVSTLKCTTVIILRIMLKAFTIRFVF
ncbi:MAG: AAA family ATPase [Treponema sp.]|nr:AAA family ATPase [Treponema sp.]